MEPDALRGVDFLSAPDFPEEMVVPGYLCRAARLMVGLTQQELHLLAGVSKKTINDYENGFIAIRPSLAARLATALRETGVRFVADDGYVGVLMCGRRTVPSRAAAGSRAGETAAGDAPLPTSARDRRIVGPDRAGGRSGRHD